MALALIWWVSAGLAGTSLGVMLLLVLKRVINTRRAKRDEILGGAATSATLDYLDGSGTPETVVAAATGRLDLLNDLLTELEQLVRGGQLERLIELKRLTGCTDRDMGLLAKGRTASRREAALRLTHGLDGAAVDALAAALGDKDAQVRLIAADGLAKAGAIRSIEALIRQLRIGSLENSRDLFTIFHRFVPERTAELTGLLATDTPDAVKVLILDALGKSGDYSVVEAIGRMTSDVSGEVRAAALSALAEMEHPAAAQEATAALYDPTWEVRAKAALCVSRLLFEGAIPRLVELLEDDHWGVRYSAGEALFQLGAGGQAALIEARRKSGAVAALADALLAEHNAAA